ASKQSRIANAWKKWQGESLGIQRTGGIARKQAFEAEFNEQLIGNPEWKAEYGDILPAFSRLYAELEPYAITHDYVTEITYRNIELFQLINRLYSYYQIYENNGLEAVKQRIDRLTAMLESFYKDYRPEIDQEVAAALLATYFQQVADGHQSPYAVDQAVYAGKNYAALAQLIYEKSFLTKSEVALNLLAQNPEGFFRQLAGDYAFEFVRNVITYNEEKVLVRYNEIQDRIDLLQRRYMEALLTVFPDRRFYPDANSTLRVTYGQVKGYEPRDAIRYEFMTHLDGVMEKYVPGDYEFDVPDRLIELYRDQDYGPYADRNGKMPVCFIGTNHTSGGNSGSPAIDAYGNLIGLNFDRTWEGTMSDINYDPSICRNIMVDIRYVLFLIDKFAGASHLVEEMTLVHPKG
ncbi:MAG: S46 family peptidase, partial [Lewinella sp.]|nr:S46 family peptidase [Lewinella sp.]